MRTTTTRRRVQQRTGLTGRQILAARILSGADQATIARLAGISRQSLSAMENAGVVVARRSTQAKVLAALGSHGVMLVPGGAIRASAFWASLPLAPADLGNVLINAHVCFRGQTGRALSRPQLLLLTRRRHRL